MKKFLKTLIIILLVLAAVGGTCYFFFKNMKEKNNTTGSIAAMLGSESKLSFNNGLQNMATLVNSDGTDNRIDVLITTNTKLDEIVYTLSTYLVDSNTSINNESIAKSLKKVNSSRSLLVKMINEYNIKKDSVYFNRHLGANDFYEEMSNYLTRYANFANLLNNYITGIDRANDIKFNMFEVYINIVRNTFANLDTTSDLVKVKSDSNINVVNSNMVIQDSYIVTSSSQFSINNNNFINYYNKCNKHEFANNLAANISSVTVITETSTNEQIATYYYKLVFGM